ncbi:MAG: universal stress protein [Deltaproteobacteria bacterium]|nr:MAG: universal stress protein [Deltaproteobacteria bacterium]
MLKRLREQILRKTKGEHKEVAVKNRQAQALRKRIERQTKAIAFAEAGLHEDAQNLIRTELAEKSKVLVVGHEDTFSQPVIQYAVGLAERMGYEILALSVSPVRTESSTLEPYCDMVCEQFRARSEESTAGFRCACKEKGISFSHVIKFGEVDQCIKEIHQERFRVEFVVTEPESCPDEGNVTIPVFCMAR